MKKIASLSEQKILKLLRSHPLEDVQTIKSIEKWLVKLRKAKVILPDSRRPVMLVVSGGLDSIIVWAYLLEVYKLQVYPLFIRRGQRRVKWEEKAVDFFFKYFKKKHGTKLCQPVFKIDSAIPPYKIRFTLTKASNKFLKDHQLRGIPVYSNLIFSVACQYAYYLELSAQIKVRTIYAGYVASDGETMRDETLTAVRQINQTLITLTGDPSWQLIALPIEKELGFFYNKDILIRWAVQAGIPLEYTRSCIMWGRFHCGACLSCGVRKNAFKDADLPDPTYYQKFSSYLFLWEKLIKKLRVGF